MLNHLDPDDSILLHTLFPNMIDPFFIFWTLDSAENLLLIRQTSSTEYLGTCG